MSGYNYNQPQQQPKGFFQGVEKANSWNTLALYGAGGSVGIFILQGFVPFIGLLFPVALVVSIIAILQLRRYPEYGLLFAIFGVIVSGFWSVMLLISIILTATGHGGN